VPVVATFTVSMDVFYLILYRIADFLASKKVGVGTSCSGLAAY